MYSLCTLHEFWGWLSWTIGCGRAFVYHMSSTLPPPTPPPAQPAVKMFCSCVTFPLLDSVWIPPLLVLSWILETLLFPDIFQLPAAAAKSLQLCLTLCDPIDSSPSGSPVPGILQARTLEWVAISFSNAWKWKVKVKSFSRIWLLATPWTAAFQAPPSIGFSRQEYWNGVPLPSPISAS